MTVPLMVASRDGKPPALFDANAKCRLELQTANSKSDYVAATFIRCVAPRIVVRSPTTTGDSPGGNGGKVPRPFQFPVVLEVALTAAQGAALRRRAAFLDVPVSELLRSLVADATEKWTDREVTQDAK